VRRRDTLGVAAQTPLNLPLIRSDNHTGDPPCADKRFQNKGISASRAA
jgi:hypothetical protein